MIYCGVLYYAGGGGSVLLSHDVPCGVLCCHVVRSGVMCCGLVSCRVVWCGGVSCDRAAFLVGSMVCWLLGRLGCLAAWVIFGCLTAGWGTLYAVCTLWCLVPYATVCSVMSCLWVPMYAIPREGGGADKQLLFLF